MLQDFFDYFEAFTTIDFCFSRSNFLFRVKDEGYNKKKYIYM
jgi:hypothetical protein